MSGLLELLSPPGKYTVKNVPPAQKEFGPVCPHFDIIAACGKLVDVTMDELNKRVDFCGEYSESYSDIAPLAGSAGYNYTAKASCREIYEKLKPLIELATEAIELPPEEQIRQQILHTESFDEQEKILHNYNSAKKRLESKKSLLDKWYPITFELDCAGSKDMRDWTDRDIKIVARDYFDRLEEIVIGKYASEAGKAAQGCPVSPRTYRRPLFWSLR